MSNVPHSSVVCKSAEMEISPVKDGAHSLEGLRHNVQSGLNRKVRRLYDDSVFITLPGRLNQDGIGAPASQLVPGSAFKPIEVEDMKHSSAHAAALSTYFMNESSSGLNTNKTSVGAPKLQTLNIPKAQMDQTDSAAIKQKISSGETMFRDVEEKDLYISIASNDILPINCRNSHALLHKNRLGSGRKGKCIKYEDNWFTPSEFENFCGLEMSKDWKRSLRYGGHSVQALINKGYLRPHASTCMCGVCCDDEAVTGPVRFFTPMNRRKRSAASSLPSTPYAVRLNSSRSNTIPSTSQRSCSAQATSPDSADNEFSDSPVDCRTKRLFSMLSEFEEQDRKVWEELDNKADCIMKSFSQLQEDIQQAKQKCKKRRNSLIEDIVAILDHQDGIDYELSDSDTLRLSKSLKDEEKLDDDVQDEDETEICRACGRPANSECTGCRKATYCSTECQEQDWNAGHKDACRGLAQQEVSPVNGNILPI